MKRTNKKKQSKKQLRNTKISLVNHTNLQHVVHICHLIKMENI